MLRQLWHKLKEAMISVLPVTIIVLILSFTPMFSLSMKDRITFIISAVFLILGVGLFSLGADMAMSPMGEHVGSSLIKTNKLKLITIVCFFMGLLITIAEPDLSVLASQVKDYGIDGTTLIVTIGIGVGLFLVLGILKIIFKKDLSMMLMFFYFLLFAVASIVIIQGNGSFLGLAFDSGGVTTGPITVPFIMALGVGVASTVGGRNANENSFGLISLCSVGPILVVLLLGMTITGDLNQTVNPNDYLIPESGIKILSSSLHKFIETAGEVALALFLIVLVFLIIQFIFIKLPKRKLLQMFIGIFYTFLGLVIFLTSVSIGFLPVGFSMGSQMAEFNKIALIIFGFVIGLVVVLAEPAIHVLTKQVEEVTMGGVSKLSLLIALCIGVGSAICLAMIRIVFDFSVVYYLIPGYFISLGLSFFVPRMYTAIAFDSGGVASGPLTSSFILPFAVGACSILQSTHILEDAFGVVALVAMAPLITIQLLGFKAVMADRVRHRIRMKKIIDAHDEQIINFM